MINLGKIKGLMAENGHKQKDLAKILDLSLQSVNLKLQGKTDFKVNELVKIARQYGVDVDIFLS